MGWLVTLYSLLGFAGAGITALVAGLAWRFRSEHEARPFMGLMVVLGAWAFVYAIQLGFTTRTNQLVWQRIGLAIGGTIPPLWLLFTLRYAGRDEWLTRPIKLVLAAEPAVFAVLTLTNPIHEFVWHGATLSSTAAGPVLRLGFSPGYYAHIAYAYLLVATGLGLLGAVVLQSSQLYRRQTSILILGALPPLIGNIAYTLRLSWGPLPMVDPTPFAFVITGVLFGLALFQFDLLDRVPIAQQRVLQEMGDGIVVVDADGVIVDANSVARQVLDPPPAVGQTLGDRVPADATTVDAALEAFDTRTRTSTIEGRERVYDAAWSALTDHRGDTIGYALALRDVTDRHEYEQRLEVAQRVLRHNLRNDMTLIRGRGEHLAKTTTNGPETIAQQIVETADDLIDLGEKVRTMVRLEETAPAEQTVIDVTERLRTLVAEFQRDYPAATVECEAPPALDVPVSAEKFFEVPVRNLLENALEHNDTAEPWVNIRVEQTADHVRVHVEDDGPEIPEIERKVLEDGTEDPLQHGNGIGLWLTYWSIRAVGGDITFDTREQRGNVVTLVFPRGDHVASNSAGVVGAPSR